VVPGEGAEPAPLVGAALSAGAGADAGSTRAAAVAGAMFGILAAASGLAWALYKFKPGIIPLGGAGAGRAGAAAPSAAAPLLGSPGAAPTGNDAPGGAPALAPLDSAPPPDRLGSAGAPASPTSTMNRGIQTDVANGPIGGAGLAAAGGASSSMLMQSTTVKNLHSTQQADSSYLDGSLLLFSLIYLSDHSE